MKDVAGIVLAGTYSWHGSAFETLRPRPLLPVAGRPLIDHVLDWLEQAGVSDVVICANCSNAAVQRYLDSAPPRACSIQYYADSTPRGTAGCVKDAAAAATNADTLVVTDGTSIPAVDLAETIAFHRDRDAAVTIVVQQRQLNATGQLYAHPTDTYVLRPDVLDAVPTRSFQDIKESLIPRLYCAGRRIEVFTARDLSPRVLDANSYLALNHWMINQMWAASTTAATHDNQSSLLAHPTAVVDDGALVVGPVVLGPHARVGPRAVIVGPSAIGAGSTIRSRSVVARSVVWEECSIGEHAVLDQCLLAESVTIEAAAKLTRVLRRSRLGRPVPHGAEAGIAPPRLAPAVARPWFWWEAARSFQSWRLFQ